MCAIVGAVVKNAALWQPVLERIVAMSTERGSDSSGYVWLTRDSEHPDHSRSRLSVHMPLPWPSEPGPATFIGHLRAEPTHEFVEDMELSDVAPFNVGQFWVAHNGTVANDQTYSDPRNRGSSIDSESIARRLHEQGCAFSQTEIWYQLKELQGSFGLLIGHERALGSLIAATNYKPIYYVILPNEQGFIFASQRRYLEEAIPFAVAKAIPQYSIMTFGFSSKGVPYIVPAYPQSPRAERVLVLCSGGLDAAVVAAVLKEEGRAITLLNFCYGQRAQAREIVATTRIAQSLGCDTLLKSLDIGIPSNSSPLLNSDQKLSDGAAGAELPNEWVPARNLVMMSHAVALAEHLGFDAIATGVNLEESNSYPDNEMEFVNRFNELLPYAIAPNKRVEILAPVGAMMKRQIIETGQTVNAPMQHSYSCYSGDEIHCGRCASCYLRRTAFKIARVSDPTIYQS